MLASLARPVQTQAVLKRSSRYYAVDNTVLTSFSHSVSYMILFSECLICHFENKNITQLKLSESEVKAAVNYERHSSLNLASRQPELRNIFIFGMAYSRIAL